ncbi:predicted protein [Uncinocarpus reesii 1704]|uniref:Uncharacterized protein n=1 Tax=Uncinocarpus reesii (strain UAMH 1704) TaxID=336963 RepID=C4JZT5_UNCRE|nr:uncharacterized protein UREG_07686 [Uncinocarpus reesii 1704]EEP82821.1 predicted protein [Uncinocarpus reesii 1704]
MSRAPPSTHCDFELEAIANFEKAHWKNKIVDFALPDGNDISEHHLLAGDHFLCGEEISISAKYVAHALNPMSAVGKEQGLNGIFGDWKATNRQATTFPSTQNKISAEEVDAAKGKGKGKAKAKPEEPTDDNDTDGRKRTRLIPDYAYMEEKTGIPWFIGEIKTPWKHAFAPPFNNLKLALQTGATEDEMSMRHILGQVGNYMIELELKWGFLTNYTHTLFLKRDVQNNQEVMYCSPPIPFDRTPSPSGCTVRQGLFLLQSKVEAGGEKPWFAKKLTETSIIKKEVKESLQSVKSRAVDSLHKLPLRSVDFVEPESFRSTRSKTKAAAATVDKGKAKKR